MKISNNLRRIVNQIKDSGRQIHPSTLKAVAQCEKDNKGKGYIWLNDCGEIVYERTFLTKIV